MQKIVDRYNSSQDDVVVWFTAPAYGSDCLSKDVDAALARVSRRPRIALPASDRRCAVNEHDHFKDLGFGQDDFIDGTWQLANIEGRQYGVTMSTGPAALGYNRALFEKAGLDPDRPPTTGAELSRPPRP